MAKRFTDTEKWSDEWFLNLDQSMKILWIYITDKCDHAGVWSVNFNLATILIGTIYDKQSALIAFGDRVTVISDEKWFIAKFIRFQYGVPLNLNNNAHRGVVKLLKYHGLQTRGYEVASELLQTKAFDSLGDKEQIQDKDKVSINTAIIMPRSAAFKDFGIHDIFQLWEDLSEKEELHNLRIAKINPEHMTREFAELKSTYLKSKDDWANYFRGLHDTDLGERKKFALNTALNPKTYMNFMNGVYGIRSTEQEDPFEH